jgi:hypothetical protein
MCPGNEESVGKRRLGKTRKGSKWLRSALTESARAAARSLGEDYFDRQRSGEAYAKRLVRQLARPGSKVALEPLPQTE